ncbi:uncharacterized protein EHS24_000329 [Apiotrichum porosum]|uniref:Uncharacterized protein n=1 Tax=Apiotrichum porosum TaxID=105984 RepID=A0A427Y9M8_9TREE|nr:uncharacterized protein EHS24_000329 [Apiotrichum porosum]RSH87812.1 hypothetical protein EHS24_000329 [Apiotrichum porosum]
MPMPPRQTRRSAMRLPLPLALLVIATPACAQSLDKWVEPKVYSPGLIAGIVIASLAALGVAIALMFGFIWCNRRRHNMLHPNRLIQALSRNSNKHDTGSSSGDSSLVEKGKGGMPTMASTAPIVVNYPVEPEKAHGGGPRGATGGLWGENLHSSGSSGQFLMPPPINYGGRRTETRVKPERPTSYDGRATYAGRGKSQNWVADDDAMLYN